MSDTLEVLYIHKINQPPKTFLTRCVTIPAFNLGLLGRWYSLPWKTTTASSEINWRPQCKKMISHFELSGIKLSLRLYSLAYNALPISSHTYAAPYKLHPLNGSDKQTRQSQYRPNLYFVHTYLPLDTCSCALTNAPMRCSIRRSSHQHRTL